jgi:SAM-dependent methyltransferase
MPGRARGDHFSSVSAAYAEFRPRYPRELLDFVASLPAARHCAWDCGAGTGQATVDLAERFDEVIGSDVSVEQLARSPRKPNIRWLVAPAESAPIDDGSVDLTTVAQALHWFDHDRFYAEVRRVAAPGAAFAAWAYMSVRMEGELGTILDRFEHGTVSAYWPPERRHVDSAYRSIPFPFERVEAPRIEIEQRWTLTQLAGYLRTWSATARFVAARGVDPVVDVERELAAQWGDPAAARRVNWPVTVLAGRI